MKPTLISLFFGLTLLNTAYLIYQQFDPGRGTQLGVVQMEEVVYEFAGMKEASNIYAGKLASWKTQLDSLQQKIIVTRQLIKQDSTAGNRSGLHEHRTRLTQLQQTYLVYQKQIQQRSEQDDQMMTAGIINQLQGFMKAYAEEHGYQVIIANTHIGNVGYVNGAQDVTQPFLAYANHKYQYGN